LELQAHARPAEAPLSKKILQMDPVGILLVMGLIISYILAMQYGGVSHAWNSSVVIGLLVGFVLITCVFIAWQVFQGEQAILIPRLMKQRDIGVSSVYAFFFGGSYFVVIYYLPIYFQSIDNVSPTDSGLRNLPLIIAFALATLAGGGIITATGLATPFTLTGAVVATIATGLLYMLDIGTSEGRWIGYQILAGLGWGLAFQIPIMVVQAAVGPEDLSSATAMILFFQTVGGAFLLAAAEAGFSNRLFQLLPSTAPAVNPALVLATGASDLRNAFSSEDLPGILVAYMGGIKVTFAIALAATGLAVLISLLSSWKRISVDMTK
jgi:hypothetical protein